MEETGFKRIPLLKELYLIYSVHTDMPFLEQTDQEFQDRVFLFEDSGEALSFCGKLRKEGKRVRSVRIENRFFRNYFTGLFYIGATELLFKQMGKDAEFMELTSFVTLPDFRKKELCNPELFTTILYYVQEAREPGDLKEKKQKLLELKEEMERNLKRARFFSAVMKTDREESDLFVFCRDEQGKIYYPLFLDRREYRKFDPKKEFLPVSISFCRLNQVLRENIEGFLLNPAGVRMVLTRKRIQQLLDSGTIVDQD